MNEKLLLTIDKIKTMKVERFDESSIKQTVILRLFSDLGWDTFDREEVYPELQLDGKRVDYSLRISGKNKVFIEAKRPEENLEKHQEQLLLYAFKEGVSLAILTNGMTWWFYLPIKNGNWTERKFYTIDFANQSENEISEKFILFLSRENILSNKAIASAEETLNSKNREKEIEISLPVVWKNLLDKPTVEFIQLLADETEKHCGYRPTNEYVTRFLNNRDEIKESESDNFEHSQVATSIAKNNKAETARQKAENTKLKVTFQNGQVINENKAIDTSIKTIEKLGFDKVKRLQVMGGVPLISDKAFNVGEKKKYKQIPKTSYYININNGTDAKKKYLEKIAQLLGEKFKVEIVDGK